MLLPHHVPGTPNLSAQSPPQEALSILQRMCSRPPVRKVDIGPGAVTVQETVPGCCPRGTCTYIPRHVARRRSEVKGVTSTPTCLWDTGFSTRCSSDSRLLDGGERVFGHPSFHISAATGGSCVSVHALGHWMAFPSSHSGLSFFFFSSVPPGDTGPLPCVSPVFSGCCLAFMSCHLSHVFKDVFKHIHASLMLLDFPSLFKERI